MAKIRSSQIQNQHDVWSNYTVEIRDVVQTEDEHTSLTKYLYRFGLVHMIQQKATNCNAKP